MRCCSALCAVFIAGVLHAEGGGGTVRAFRVVGDESVRLTDIHPRQLDCVATGTSARCQIQWTPALGGYWLTNHCPATVLVTGSNTIPISSTIATGTPSTVLWCSDPVLNRSRYGGDQSVDVDRDGIEDFLLTRQTLSTDDVPSSGSTTWLELTARGAEVSPLPAEAGTTIHGIEGGGPDDLFSSRSVLIYRISESEYDEHGFVKAEVHEFGPWAGVTEACIPVRLRRGGRSHLGWVRLRLPHIIVNGVTSIWADGFMVLDSGLQALPGTPIVAGER